MISHVFRSQTRPSSSESRITSAREDMKADIRFYRFLFPTLIFSAVLLLGACNSQVQVIETGVEPGTYTETIHINNCGGKADREQTAQRSFAASIEGQLN